MEKNKKMTTIIVAAILLLTVIGVTVAYFAVSVINWTRQNLSATTVESVNLTLDDKDAASYSGQVSFGTTVTRNLKLTNEGGPTKVALYFQDLINTYTAGAFTYTLSYATTENGSYTGVLTDVAIPRRSKASSTAKITEIDMPATSTRYYRIVITYNNLNENQTRDLTATFKTGFTIKGAFDATAVIPAGDYLKDFCGALNSSGNCTYKIDGLNVVQTREKVLGNSNVVKNSINAIKTVNTNTVPNDAIMSWDVSSAGNGSIMAWTKKAELKRYYSSLSACNADNTNILCETVTPTTVYYDTSNTSIGWRYEVDCWNNTEDNCAEGTMSIRGTYLSDDVDDLYIGQDGGVVANPNSAHLFSNYSGVEEIDLSNLNTQYVTNMARMFYNTYMSTINLSNFDTSNVIDMSYMFCGSQYLNSLNVSSFNTSNVTNMENMFGSCKALTTLNLNGFNTSNVTNMKTMFASMEELLTLNISTFDTANVTTMKQMFYYSSKINTLDLSSFDTSNVTDMSYMFDDSLYTLYHNLTSLDLSNFDTACVTDMSYMFRGKKALTNLSINNFDTSNVTTMEYMFYNLENIQTLNVSNFKTDKLQNIHNMFYGLYKLDELRINSMIFDNIEYYPWFLGSIGITATNPLKIYVNENGKSFIDTNFSDYSSNVVLV